MDGLAETGISAKTLHEIRENLNKKEVAVRFKFFMENGLMKRFNQHW